MSYLLTGHLGSMLAVTDASGTLVADSQQRYMPFGEARLAADAPTDFGFTGQRTLEATGLMDYNARWYDASLGRFVSTDIVVPDFGNPQAFNRFSYVVNRPTKLIDPSGYKFCDEIGFNGACIQYPGSLVGGGSGQVLGGNKPKQAYCDLRPENCGVVGGTSNSTVSSNPQSMIIPTPIGSCSGCEFLEMSIKNTSMAWTILNDPRASYWARQLAISYIGLEALGTAAGVAGVSGLGCAAVPACEIWAANTLGIGIGGRALQSVNVSQVAADLQKWLGNDLVGITNKAGDFILRNADNTRRFRFDFFKVSPHLNPHMHLEWWSDEVGKWLGIRIFPIDVPPY